MKRTVFSGFIITLAIALIAWGSVGHRTVATIAANHLTPQAREAIRKLIGDTTLADISNWADEVRSSDPAYKATGSWHYINLPSGYNFEQFAAAVQGMKTPNVYNMLLKSENDLKSDTTSQHNRVIALKFVVHLIGDMHQPMHVSHGSDQGGNLIQVTFNNEQVNLHSLWDSRLIREHPLTIDQFTAECDNATPAQITKWQNDDMLLWLYESYLIAEQIYVQAAKNPRFNQQYYETAMPIIRKRILQGGIRLAGVLNEIYK